MTRALPGPLARILELVKPKAHPKEGILGSFAHVDTLVQAVKDAKEKQYAVLDVFSPVPVEEVMELQSKGKSPVRFVTFGGALTGIVGGFALAIGTSVIWDMIVGGKPVTHHVPFVVVGFELMILLGALATLLAILVFSRLPYRQFPGPAYRPEFSEDQFGLWLGCDNNNEENIDKIRRFMVEAGASQVRVIGEEAKGGGP
jgi:hypothetical protein